MEPNKRKPNRPSGAAEDVELSSKRQQATNVSRPEIKRERLIPRDRDRESARQMRDGECRGENEPKVGAN